MDHLATPDPPRSTPPRFLSFAAFAIGSIGFVLLACALAATQSWLDRHFLPSFLLPRDWYVRIETTARIGVGSVGMLLVLGARPAGRLIGRAPVRVLSTIIAAVLALGASEVVLRRVHLRPTEWLISDEEPLRQPDSRLGWVLVPSRTGRTTVGGRTID